VDLLALRYFQTVARLESMTQAAARLQISQPALSKMIGNLEKELTVRLFDRRGKYIRLNGYGERFLARVDEALRSLEDGRQELLDLAERPTGTVTILNHVGSYLLPDIIAGFRERHPDTQFRVVQHSEDLPSAPAFDLCIASAPFRIPGTVSSMLLTEEVRLAVPEDHRLAGRASVRLSELAEDGFISLKRGKLLRDATDALCQAAGFTPQISYECDDPSMVRSLIRAGLGIAFIPAVTWGGSQGAAVTLLPLEDPAITRTLEISWYPDRYMTKAAKTFKAYVQSYYSDLVRAAGAR